jgi:peptidoglycan/LPS O-acetylase OafA/YrhL
VFFVLSGLCIHLPIARRLARGEPAGLELGPYFKRRLLRIYPPHALVIGLSWLTAAYVHLPPGWENYLSVPTRVQFWAHVFMLHTFVPGATYSINSVLWTIAIESHFYLVYPLLLVLRRRVGMGTICAGLFGLTLALYGLDHALHPPLRGMLTYNFLGRWWEWVLGAVIAERLVRAPFRPLPRGPVLAATVAAALGFCWGQGWPHGVLIMAVAYPFVSGLVVWWAARMDARESRWLDRALVAVGLRSYSLYLTHPITLTLVAVLAAGRLTSAWAEVAVSMAASYAVTWLYFALVERRFLSKSARAAAVPTVAVSAGS